MSNDNDDHNDDYQMDEAVNRRELEERKYQHKDPLKEAGKIFAVDEEDLEEEQKEVIGEAPRAAPADEGKDDDEGRDDPLHGTESGTQGLQGPGGVAVTAPVPGSPSEGARAGFIAQGEADKLGDLDKFGSNVSRTVASGDSSQVDVIGPGSGIAGQVAQMVDNAQAIAGGGTGSEPGDTVAVGGTGSGATATSPPPSGGTSSGTSSGSTTSGSTSTTSTTTSSNPITAFKQHLISINTDDDRTGGSGPTSSPIGIDADAGDTTGVAYVPTDGSDEVQQIRAAQKAAQSGATMAPGDSTQMTTAEEIAAIKTAGSTVATTAETIDSGTEAIVAGSTKVVEDAATSAGSAMGSLANTISEPTKTYTKSTTGTQTLSTGENNVPSAGTSTMTTSEAAAYHYSRGSGLAPTTTSTAKTAGSTVGGLASSYLANKQTAAPTPYVAPKTYNKPTSTSTTKNYTPPAPSTYTAPTSPTSRWGGSMKTFK